MAVMGDEAMLGHVLNGRYRIVELIARGGMASVFLADDTRLDRQVAVKIMRNGLGDVQVFTERFRREARAAAKLNHRNVVAVFDQGTDGDITYLVMEYVPGRTLRDVMRDESPMPSLRALDLIEQVLIALSAAHEAHIVHRDIKPENVLISPDGEVKVADFGLARAVSSATTATGNALIGTVSYLAPEIVVHEGTDARSDVYAVGAVLYEMLTGLKPHHGDTPIQVAYKHVHEDIGPPSAVRPGLPAYVDALVARATARERDKRSADARVLLLQVRKVQQALRDGVEDDEDLVDDLVPYAALATVTGVSDDTTPVDLDIDDETDALTMAVPDTDGGPEHTVVWTSGPVKTDIGPVPAPPPPPEKEKKSSSSSRKGRILLALALLLTLSAAGTGWYFGVGRYDDAPNLVNLTQEEAADKAKEAGFEFAVADEKFSETVPAGSVISTDPEAGERVLPGDTIEATISLGKERYAVPELTGMTIEQAREALDDLNLVLGKTTEQYHQDVPEGNVVGIDGLEVGELVKRDTKVDVIISKGREPLEITDHTGKSRDEAVDALQGAGFTVNISEQFSDSIPAGTVISQNPASGTLLRGDPISLVVSKGPELFAVPDVVGMRRGEAIDTLESAGFTVETEGRFGGRIESQSPAAGEMHPKGTVVVIER